MARDSGLHTHVELVHSRSVIIKHLIVVLDKRPCVQLVRLGSEWGEEC